MQPGDMNMVRRWLTATGETDPAVLKEVAKQCRDGNGDYWVSRAKEWFAQGCKVAA